MFFFKKLSIEPFKESTFITFNKNLCVVEANKINNQTFDSNQFKILRISYAELCVSLPFSVFKDFKDVICENMKITR